MPLCAVGLIPLTDDGICNDETNNAECFYDFGDCCLSEKNTDHCHECICYGEELCRDQFIPTSVGDGVCNDETNNEACYNDGGDCCRPPVNKDHCSNCECKSKRKYSFRHKFFKS